MLLQKKNREEGIFLHRSRSIISLRSGAVDIEEGTYKEPTTAALSGNRVGNLALNSFAAELYRNFPSPGRYKCVHIHIYSLESNTSGNV